MRKIYYLLAIIMSSIQANAQYMSLSSAGLEQLKVLHKVNPEIQYLIQQQQHLADQAMDTLPDPIETISTEGKLKGDPIKIATQHALKDFRKIYALALIYKIYGNPAELQKAADYLLAWAKVNHPAGNPINDTNLDGAIEGYDLIKKNLQTTDNELIVNWLHQIAEAEINTMPKNQNKETAYNNWNSHRLKIIGEIAFATGDTSLQSFTIIALKKQLEVNLLPDGTSIDFKLRDALHYHVYDLEPLLKLAIVIKKATGKDFYNYQTTTHAAIKKSVEWLLPFITGAKKHGEFVHSTVQFDQDRAKNGEAGYQAGTLFDPANGLRTLALAAWFDPGLLTIYHQVKGIKADPEGWQLMLNSIGD